MIVSVVEKKDVQRIQFRNLADQDKSINERLKSMSGSDQFYLSWQLMLQASTMT